MATETFHAIDEAVETSLSILRELLSGYPSRDFAMRLWDGTMWDAEPGQPTRFTPACRNTTACRHACAAASRRAA